MSVNSLGTATTVTIPFRPAPPCPICGAASARAIESVTDFGLGLNYVCCDGCGLVSMDPRPTEEGMLAFYEGRYWDELSSGSGSGSAKQAIVGRHQLWFARQHMNLSAVASVLEIGSSHGQTLAQFQRAVAPGARIYGIEPSATARKNSLANCPAIEFTGKSYTDLAERDDGLDLVIMSHVLEHLDDPVRALRLIAARLTPRGRALVEVPNYYGHPSVQLAHNFLFTPASFKNCVAAAGLCTVALRLSDRQTERNPVYITALLAPGDSMDTPAPEVESFEAVQHRRAGMTLTWKRYVGALHGEER